MSELSIGQRDTIRLAYSAAEKSGNDTVLQNRVQQLSQDFGISEDEVHSVASSSAGAPKKLAVPVTGKARSRHSRDDWAPEQIRQLMVMHNQGKGPTAIAGALGCEIKRVQAKLYNLKKKGILREPDVEEAVPKAPAPVENSTTPEPESKEPTQVPHPAVPKIQIPDFAITREQIKQTMDSVKAMFPTASASTDSSEDEEEDPETFIDMPDALLLLMGLVQEHYGDNVTQVHASNDEHYAGCSFEKDGVEYDLRLEVSK